MRSQYGERDRSSALFWLWLFDLGWTVPALLPISESAWRNLLLWNDIQTEWIDSSRSGTKRELLQRAIATMDVHMRIYLGDGNFLIFFWNVVCGNCLQLHFSVISEAQKNLYPVAAVYKYNVLDSRTAGLLGFQQQQAQKCPSV